jgi:hypothetical protein
MTCTCRTTCKVRQTRAGLTFRAVLCSRFTAGVRYVIRAPEQHALCKERAAGVNA